MNTFLRGRVRNILAFAAIIFAACISKTVGQRAQYCSGNGETAVIFLSDNEGKITDGAVDTGMGVYRALTDCKWVLQPISNEAVRNLALASPSSPLHFINMNAP